MQLIFPNTLDFEDVYYLIWNKF